MTIVVILELECIVWNELQKLAAHYSKSLIFVQKVNFDKILFLEIFEFFAPKWEDILEYFILQSIK